MHLEEENMSKTLKVTTDNEISVIEVDFNDFRSIQNAIGGYFETVKTLRMRSYFGRPLMIMVDEEGLIKGLPTNKCGSWLYGMDRHGCRIAGDFILAVPTDDGNILSPDNLDSIKEKLIKDFNLVEK